MIRSGRLDGAAEIQKRTWHVKGKALAGRAAGLGAPVRRPLLMIMISIISLYIYIYIVY